MYQAVYKCRLCSKKIIQEIPEQAQITVHSILGCEYDGDFYSHEGLGNLTQTTLHNCQDGSLGFVDFQGFKKMEE